MHFHPSS
jgi:hypothetical protein